MKASIVDIIIVLLLISGFITGYKKGLIKQAISTIGLIIVVVLAFLLKNYSSLNILLYELLSFFILFIIFNIILKIILKITGMVENIVDDSGMFRLLSKILGGVLGALESYISIFIILLVLSLPLFSINFTSYLNKSKLRKHIMNNTLLISNIAKPLVKTIDGVNDLEIQKNIGTKEFNCKTIEIFKKNKIVSEESLKYLKKQKKLDVDCK